MIQRLKSGKGAVARFGRGTVLIKPYVLKTRFGGQIELTEIKKVKDLTKATDKDKIPGTNKIVLDFSNLESVNSLIHQLENLRDDMVNDSEKE